MTKVALIGLPNVGKTTLFNAVTGRRNKVGNWDGVTVDVSSAKLLFYHNIELFDLPGITTIDGQNAPDQQLTIELLNSEKFDVILNIVDAKHLQRDLQLSAELLRKNAPVTVIVLDHDNVIDAEKFDLQCNHIVLDMNQPRVVHTIASCIKNASVAQHDITPLHIENIAKKCKKETDLSGKFGINWQNFCDSMLMHKVFAIPIFLMIMSSTFYLTIVGGDIIKEPFSRFIAKILIDDAMMIFDYLGMHNSMFSNIYQHGIGGGVAIVAEFIPIITLLHLFLTLIEESGYMSRISVIMGGLLSRIGLPGHAIMPLIMGFGCNVPAVLGTRIIEKKSHRLLTMLLIPFMSCTARLAVYSLFVSIFFPDKPIIILFLYLFSILIAIMLALAITNKKKAQQHQHFSNKILPRYRLPNLKRMLRTIAHKIEHFVKEIGTLIVILSAILYILGQVTADFRYVGGENRNSMMINEQSILVHAGEAVTPLFKPMGVTPENWPAVVCLLTGVIAKEAVLSTIMTLYGMSADGANGDSMLLRQHMKEKFPTESAVFAYLLFVMLYFPCVSVFAVMRREAGVKIALFTAIFNTFLAYFVAVLFYQISELLHTNIFITLAIVTAIIAVFFRSIKRFLEKMIT